MALLARHSVAAIADVRRFAGSRRHPQFGAEALARELPARGIRYEPFAELGGRRRGEAGSANDGWEHPAFRAYADHMASAEFAGGLARLEDLARSTPTAVMCAEGPWWRCHRRLVADALTARGWEVDHVMPDGRLSRHALTPFAVVGQEGSLTYPAPQLRLGGESGAEAP